jgi:aspartyl-tRNA(Asn)/glutamyl-tRNA(Gln) amidotransferase subunit A
MTETRPKRVLLCLAALASLLSCGRIFGQTAGQDLTALSLKKASNLLRSKSASPVELTEACLRRIEKLNPAINAFITLTGDAAIAAAREMEAEQHRGRWRGPLHGIPIAIKDNIDTSGLRTTAASELFKDRFPSEDAEVVRRLKAAGAVILGKLNMHEFAYGPTSAVSYFGPVHNPWALDRIFGRVVRRGPRRRSRLICALARWALTPAARSEFPVRIAASQA